MSHTTKLSSVAIRDVSAIRQAVAKLKARGVNVELLENTTARMYYERQAVRCEYVLRLPGRFDVGLKLQADGTYAPIFDEHANIVAQTLGADVNACPIPNTEEGAALHQIDQFVMAYSEAAAVNAAVAQGMSVESSSVDATGQVHLVLTGV